MASEIPELPPKQLIQWLRNKIKDYTDLVEKLEKVFGIDETQAVRPRVRAAPASLTSLTEDQLVSAINHKSARVHGIAARLGVSEEDIHSMIEASNGRIFVAERGWLKVRDGEALL